MHAQGLHRVVMVLLPLSLVQTWSDLNPELLINTRNPSNLVKNWIQIVWNECVRLAMPIDNEVHYYIHVPLCDH